MQNSFTALTSPVLTPSSLAANIQGQRWNYTVQFLSGSWVRLDSRWGKSPPSTHWWSDKEFGAILAHHDLFSSHKTPAPLYLQAEGQGMGPHAQWGRSMGNALQQLLLGRSWGEDTWEWSDQLSAPHTPGSHGGYRNGNCNGRGKQESCRSLLHGSSRFRRFGNPAELMLPIHLLSEKGSPFIGTPENPRGQIFFSFGFS